MDHPNIVKLYQKHLKYEDFIVMEMELGEETLSGYSKTHQDTHGKPVSEEKCALMMKGLL